MPKSLNHSLFSLFLTISFSFTLPGLCQSDNYRLPSLDSSSQSNTSSGYHNPASGGSQRNATHSPSSSPTPTSQQRASAPSRTSASSNPPLAAPLVAGENRGEAGWIGGTTQRVTIAVPGQIANPHGGIREMTISDNGLGENSSFRIQYNPTTRTATITSLPGYSSSTPAQFLQGLGSHSSVTLISARYANGYTNSNPQTGALSFLINRGSSPSSAVTIVTALGPDHRQGSIVGLSTFNPNQRTMTTMPEIIPGLGRHTDLINTSSLSRSPSPYAPQIREQDRVAATLNSRSLPQYNGSLNFRPVTPNSRQSYAILPPDRNGNTQIAVRTAGSPISSVYRFLTNSSSGSSGFIRIANYYRE